MSAPVSPIATSDDSVDRMSRFQALQAGQYWRAVNPIAEQGIDAGTVLLIQSIRWVDDAPHTIILRPHPSKIGTDVHLTVQQEDGSTKDIWFSYDEHRFLLNDFLKAFEFEMDHQRIRNAELQQVQDKITDIQNELLRAQSDPALLASVVESELRKQAPDQEKTGQQPGLPVTHVTDQAHAALATGTVANAIGSGITAEGIVALKASANREHQVATIKAKWIQGKTSEIATTIKAMTPFYAEQAAAALAQTEDVRAYVDKLMKGIESLDLYVGKDVEVDSVRSGQSADKDVPLTFVQKKLMMDEELAVFTDIDEWFDFGQESKFFEALRAHDALVQQIFPTERCVLVMATTRRYIDYGDKWTNAQRNAENRKVFLLVRDGMNIHRVFSPVESHLGAARLFPSQNDQNRVFSGSDGSQIKFEDVAYTDKLSDHEKFALHYKRFLLLVCGLDHRLKLFGDFYEGPQSLDFVSMGFQEKYCRFLHDDQNTLPGEPRLTLDEWLAEKNGYLGSGSRVLCNWEAVMDPDTAPSACKSDGRHGFERRYSPKTPFGMVVAYSSADSICVDTEVSGYSYSIHENRTFNCKVNLSKDRNGWDRDSVAFLCLDSVRPEELHWYIQNRETRRDHLAYIRFFKHALKHIQQELAVEHDARQRMLAALAEGKIAHSAKAEAIVHEAVVAWRAANRGKALPVWSGVTAPTAWKSLLDQMYMLAGEGASQTKEIEDFLSKSGQAPLRLALSGKAKLVVYAAPRDEERDDRMFPHCWVHRITLERGKTKLIEKARRWVLLPKAVAAETTLYEWAGASDWLYKNPVFTSFEKKQEIFAATANFKSLLAPFIGSEMDEKAFSSQLSEWEFRRELQLRGAKHVSNPSIAIPFGLVHFPRTKETRFLCIGTHVPHALLYRLAPDDAARRRLQHEFVKPYANKEHAHKEFKADIAETNPWRLFEMSAPARIRASDIYARKEEDVSLRQLGKKHSVDPLLANWFEEWVASEKDTHLKVWLANGALDADGRLSFDELLGIKRQEDYDPVHVCEITIFKNNDGSELPEHRHWFDILRKEDGDVTKAFWDRSADRLVPKGFGYSSSERVFASPAEAREYIKRKSADIQNCQATFSAELPNAFVAPDDVERWYVVHRTQ